MYMIVLFYSIIPKLVRKQLHGNVLSVTRCHLSVMTPHITDILTVSSTAWSYPIMYAKYQNCRHILRHDNSVENCRWDKSSPHDDVIEWKHFLRYWPFVRGIHRSPVNSPHTKASDVELWRFLWSTAEQTVELTIETPVIWKTMVMMPVCRLPGRKLRTIPSTVWSLANWDMIHFV